MQGEETQKACCVSPLASALVPSNPPLMRCKAFPGSGRVSACCMWAEHDISAFQHRLAVSP